MNKKRSREEQAEQDRLREAEEVGCYGLLRGVARSLQTDEEWQAEIAHRDYGPFYCPVCYSDAVLRKCTEKIDHYAHKSRLSPVLGPKETALHAACKEEIRAQLANRFPDGKWASEREIPENKEHKIPLLRPDVSGRIGDHRVVVEVQASALTIPKIVKRTQAYAKRGICILWVVPLHEPLGHLPFRPRLYERYLHSIYYGRVYYWWAGQGVTLTPVHYGPAKRHIEYREWYEDGEEQSAGGYEATYKTIKTPIYGAPLNLSTDFTLEERGAFTPENERKEVPACRLWQDRLSPWW